MASSKDRDSAVGPAPAQASADDGASDDVVVDGISPLDLVAALARLDLEVALAYEAAADLPTDAAMGRQLGAFSRDHRRHLARLNALLEEHGAEKVEAPSGGASVLAGLMKLAGPLGPEVIVMALLADEQLTNLSYDGALAYAWEDDVERVLQELRADEERHLSWLAERHEAAGSSESGAEPTVPSA